MAVPPDAIVERAPPIPPIVAVQSAVPAFVGYTARRGRAQAVVEVRSMREFEEHFGEMPPVRVTSIRFGAGGTFEAATLEAGYHLGRSVRLFFANGGARCFVVSAGAFGDRDSAETSALLAALAVAATQEEVTLLVAPDAVQLDDRGRTAVQQAMLRQAAERGDRFAILDVPDAFDWKGGLSRFRQGIGSELLAGGAAYAPWLLIPAKTSFRYREIAAHLEPFRATQPAEVQGTMTALDGAIRSGHRKDEEALEARLRAATPAYRDLLRELEASPVAIPPSGSVAGMFARVDRSHGVWKAPAGQELSGLTGLTASITTSEQEASFGAASPIGVNAIRPLAGRGVQVWGARTLESAAGTSRYVSVRRMALMLEASITKGCASVVFEPNDEPLWARLRAAITTFLTEQWRAGAFQGSRSQEAFYVRVGLGSTMTEVDQRAGRIVIDVGVAPLQPAEFVVLRLELRATPK